MIVEEHTSLDKLAEMNHRLQALVDDYNANALHPISYAVGYDVSYRNHYYLIPDFLTVAGCNEMQGFYYYKPMPSEGFSELLDSMQ